MDSVTHRPVKERLAILEDNSHQTLEILRDIRDYMTKTDIQEHRLTLIESHCATCDLNERVSTLERAHKWVRATFVVFLGIASGVSVNYLWDWWMKWKGGS